MRPECEFVKEVPPPAASSIVGLYQPMNLAAAFAIRLPAGATGNPDLLARFLVSNQPSRGHGSSHVRHFGLPGAIPNMYPGAQWLT